MNNFIELSDYDATIHRDILDSLLRVDTKAAVIEVCENRAIQTVRSLIASRYDVDKIFSERGESRNVLILKVCIDIAVYEIFCQHNPYKISDIRKERYKDAMQFLREVRDHEANIEGAPTLQEDKQRNNSPWLIGGETIRHTRF